MGPAALQIKPAATTGAAPGTLFQGADQVAGCAQPVIHLVNWLVYPLQIPLLLVFIRLGEKIVGAPPVPFSITDMLQRFKDSPAQFFRDFGLTGLHGIGGWLLVAPLMLAILYFTLRPVLRKMAQIKIG